MLEDRKLTISHSNIIEERSAGCPQEELLSPLLWCLVVDELLTKLRESGFQVYGCADDVTIVIRGNFFTTLKERMERSFDNHAKLV